MFKRGATGITNGEGVAKLVSGYSIEVLPRAADDIDTLVEVIPGGTRVYVAQTEGVTHGAVATAARRFRDKGYVVMPHIPARAIKSRAMLEKVLRMYRDEAGVDEALVIAGGMLPCGEFESSIQLLETGLFDRLGFRRLHVAGHPEGNKATDEGTSTCVSDKAILWKQNYSTATGVEMAIITQFVFDAAPVTAWAERLRGLGVTLPIHVGVAGPAKLSTLIKYAIACGVGPSLGMLQRRATDIAKLIVPYEPNDLIAALAAHKSDTPDSLIEKVHFFAFGGVQKTVEWANQARR